MTRRLSRSRGRCRCWHVSCSRQWCRAAHASSSSSSSTASHDRSKPVSTPLSPKRNRCLMRASGSHLGVGDGVGEGVGASVGEAVGEGVGSGVGLSANSINPFTRNSGHGPTALGHRQHRCGAMSAQVSALSRRRCRQFGVTCGDLITCIRCAHECCGVRVSVTPCMPMRACLRA